MSIIKLPLRFEGSLGEKIIYTFFDSSATFQFISQKSVEDVESLVKMPRPLEIAIAAVNQYLRITRRVMMDFYYNDIRMQDEFMVIPSLSEDAIFGVNTFQKWRIKLDFEHDTVIIDPKVAKAILK